MVFGMLGFELSLLSNLCLRHQWASVSQPLRPVSRCGSVAL